MLYPIHQLSSYFSSIRSQAQTSNLSGRKVSDLTHCSSFQNTKSLVDKLFAPQDRILNMDRCRYSFAGSTDEGKTGRLFRSFLLR